MLDRVGAVALFDPPCCCERCFLLFCYFSSAEYAHVSDAQKGPKDDSVWLLCEKRIKEVPASASPERAEERQSHVLSEALV